MYDNNVLFEPNSIMYSNVKYSHSPVNIAGPFGVSLKLKETKFLGEWLPQVETFKFEQKKIKYTNQMQETKR